MVGKSESGFLQWFLPHDSLSTILVVVVQELFYRMRFLVLILRDFGADLFVLIFGYDFWLGFCLGDRIGEGGR